MNSVAWFIYAAQVSSSLGGLCIGGGIVIIMGVTTVFAAPRLFTVMDTHSLDDYNKRVAVFKGFRKGWFSLACLLLVLGCLIPEKNTMYAIAVAQVGEQIVNSENTKGIATDATLALRQWIKKQIEPETKK